MNSKVLCRNTYAQSALGSVSSSADVLNLVSTDLPRAINIIQHFLDILVDQVETILGGVYVWLLLGELCFNNPADEEGQSGLWGLCALIATNLPAYCITKAQYKVSEKRLAISDERMGLMQEVVQAISMIKMMAAESFWSRRISEVRDRELKQWLKARLLEVLTGVLR